MRNEVRLLWALVGMLLVISIANSIKIHDMQNINNIQQETIHMLIDNQQNIYDKLKLYNAPTIHADTLHY